MAQAKILINTFPTSQDDLPIGVLVQLDNDSIGGELTYKWYIDDQPPGAVDALSSDVIKDPTFTPKKEGSYLIRVVVNLGLVTEQTDKKVAAIRQLKTLERLPAAGETTEVDASDGWATAMNAVLRRIDTLLSDPGVIVGVNASGGVLNKGSVVRCTVASIIKSGLPGQETVPGFTLATALALTQVDELLCVILGTPAGGAAVANGALMQVRYIGRYTSTAGAPAVGDPVYLSDAGTLALAAGTIKRQVGSVMSVGGGQFDTWFNGVGGADITPIDRRYVVHGAPGTLTDAVRVDGANATGLTTPFRVKAGDAATVAFQVQQFGAGLDLTQWLNVGGAVIARVTNAGQLTLDAEGISIPTASKHVTFGNSGQRIAWPNWYVTQSAASAVDLVNTGVVGTPPEVQFTHDLVDFITTINLRTHSDPLSDAVMEWKADGRNWESEFGTVVDIPLYFKTDNTRWWGIAATGELQGIGGNQAINNVLDPTGAQDAATKNYVDAHALRNLLINGDFLYWQRGTTIFSLSSAGAALRQYFPDRWYGYAKKTAGGVNFVGWYDYATGDPKIARGTVAAGSTGEVALIQEIDRDMVAKMAGSGIALRVRLTAKRGANFYADNQTFKVRVYYGTGGADENYCTPYTGNTPHANVTVALTASYATYEVDVPALPSNATKACVQLFVDCADSGGGAPGGDTYAYFQDCMLHPRQATVDRFEWAAGDPINELDACQRFYEKSFDVATAPGAGGLNGQAAGVVASNGGAKVGVPNVSYKVRKRVAAGTVTIYATVSGATGNVQFNGGDATCIVHSAGETGFQLAEGAAWGAMGDRYLFTWTADAEI